jgi:hypothetical protein
MDKIDQQQADNRATLYALAEKVRNTEPWGTDFIDRLWMEDNKDKIIRNKRLIELLG